MDNSYLELPIDDEDSLLPLQAAHLGLTFLTTQLSGASNKETTAYCLKPASYFQATHKPDTECLIVLCRRFKLGGFLLIDCFVFCIMVGCALIKF